MASIVRAVVGMACLLIHSSLSPLPFLPHPPYISLFLLSILSLSSPCHLTSLSPSPSLCHTSTHTHRHTQTHTHTCAHGSAHARTHARTPTRIHTHARTHTHTHAHTQTFKKAANQHHLRAVFSRIAVMRDAFFSDHLSVAAGSLHGLSSVSRCLWYRSCRFLHVHRALVHGTSLVVYLFLPRGLVFPLP